MIAITTYSVILISIANCSKQHQNLRIVSYATDASPAAHLTNFTQHYNLDFTLIGVGDKWHGLNTKITGYHNYLKSKKSEYDDNDIILMLDAYDTITICDQDTFLDKFNSFHADIIMSTDRTCWPDPNLQNYLLSRMNQTFKSQHPWFPYFVCINSGAIIGEYSAMLSMLETVNKFVKDGNGSCSDFEGNEFNLKTQSDQRCYTTFYVKWLNGEFEKESNVSIKLDHTHDLFATLGGVPHFRYDIEINENETRFINKFTNKSGCVLHGNGPGVIIWRNLIQQIINNGEVSIIEHLLRINHDFILIIMVYFTVPFQRLSHFTSKYFGFKIGVHSTYFGDTFLLKFDLGLLCGLIIIKLLFNKWIYSRNNTTKKNINLIKKEN